MSQSMQVVAKHEDLSLRETREEDLDYVFRLEQQEENKRFIMPWTLEQHRQALSHPDFAHLLIETDEGRIGVVLIAGLENVHRSIELRRIVIAPKGQGYGKKTLHLLKALAFEKWHAHRLWLDVFEENGGARHVYESQGFLVEGTLRECYQAGENQRFASLVVMSILRSEYRNAAKASCPYLM